MLWETERLAIRSWMPDDASRMFEMFSDPEIAKWTSRPTPMAHVDEALERIATFAKPIDGHADLGIWTLVPRDTGLASGTILLRPLADVDDHQGLIEIGWSLNRDAWGNGYAGEAAAGALQRAWDLGYDEVRAIMWPDNHRSAAVCERIGMTDLGSVIDPWHGDDDDPTSRMFRAVRQK